MLVPYKAKNPPDYPPYATYLLIGINTLVFAFTSENFLVIKESAVRAWALVPAESRPITFLTSMFLHGSFFHLLGNMWFLWLFGPALESRLRTPLYLTLYFAAGFLGDLFQTWMSPASGAIPNLGASGCIMGVAGAAAFVFPFARICVWYWFGVFAMGVFEIKAFWLIGFYFALDVLEGMTTRDIGGAGVGNFAHIGGALVGAILVAALRVKRDSYETSEARASVSELGSLKALSLSELAALARAANAPPSTTLLYLTAAVEAGNFDAAREAAKLLDPTHAMENAAQLLESGAHQISDAATLFSPMIWFQIAQEGLKLKQPQVAALCYQQIARGYPQSKDAPTALRLLAKLQDEELHQPQEAAHTWKQLADRYPNSPEAFDAHLALEKNAA